MKETPHARRVRLAAGRKSADSATISTYRAAMEAAEHWLAEEAASPHPGQTRPDEILRVIREALGKPHNATDAAGWRGMCNDLGLPCDDDGPDAAPAAPQTSEALAALENAEAFILDCPASAHRDAVLRDVRGAISSAPQSPDASALMLAALKGAANALTRFDRIADLIEAGQYDLAKASCGEPWNPEVAAVNAAIAAAEGREG